MASEWEARLDTVRERQGLSPRWIVGVGVGTAAFLVIAMAALWLFYVMAGKAGGWRPASHFPGPELQIDPARDLREYLKSQAEQLQTYGWVDRQHDLIRVPIDRAMGIVAARGDAAYDPPAVVSGTRPSP